MENKTLDTRQPATDDRFLNVSTLDDNEKRRCRRRGSNGKWWKQQDIRPQCVVMRWSVCVCVVCHVKNGSHSVNLKRKCSSSIDGILCGHFYCEITFRAVHDEYAQLKSALDIWYVVDIGTMTTHFQCFKRHTQWNGWTRTRRKGEQSS